MDEKQIDDYLKSMGVVEGLRLFGRQIYLAGAAEQSKRDREAVEEIPWPKENFTEDQINFCGGIILAALEAARGGK